jgi:hypothetical protein
MAARSRSWDNFQPIRQQPPEWSPKKARLLLQICDTAIAIYFQRYLSVVISFTSKLLFSTIYGKILIERLPVGIVRIRIIKHNTFVMGDCFYTKRN